MCQIGGFLSFRMLKKPGCQIAESLRRIRDYFLSVLRDFQAE